MPLCLSGLRCAGFLIRHQLHTGQQVTQELVGAVVKVSDIPLETQEVVVAVVNV